MKKSKFDVSNTDYTNKVLNVLSGLKMKYPNGIAARELKDRLAKLGVSTNPNVFTKYIKCGVLTKLCNGRKASYLINPQEDLIIKAHDAFRQQSVLQQKKINKPSSEITRVIKMDNFVDLDLPSGTLWAKCNIGATCPEEYGEYFKWGNISTDEDNKNIDRYTIEDHTALELKDDAAYVNTNGTQKMPSVGQIKELLEHTDSIWTSINGINGRKFISKQDSSKYIFIPASGYYDGSSVYGVGSYGYLWSSSRYSYPTYAYYLYFRSGGADVYDDGRYVGCTVRGVFVENKQQKINDGNQENQESFKISIFNILDDIKKQISELQKHADIKNSIELLTQNNYFVQKLEPGITITVTQTIQVPKTEQN